MPRNMDRRIEIMFPITNTSIKSRIIDDILSLYWSDNTKSHQLKSDGVYTKKEAKKSKESIRSQEKLISLIREKGVKSIPYEKAIRHDSSRKKGARPISKKTSTKASKTAKATKETKTNKKNK
jgi:polyphosphate kinase